MHTPHYMQTAVLTVATETQGQKLQTDRHYHS